jgi:IstB-like ATP binding protein
MTSAEVSIRGKASFQLRIAVREGRLDRRMRIYLAPKVLVIDKVGYLPLDDLRTTIFSQLVSARCERSSIILTSNKSYGDWGSIFGDLIIATAILDRLLHHSTTISIRGESYRLKDRRKAGLVPPGRLRVLTHDGGLRHSSKLAGLELSTLGVPGSLSRKMTRFLVSGSAADGTNRAPNPLSLASAAMLRGTCKSSPVRLSPFTLILWRRSGLVRSSAASISTSSSYSHQEPGAYCEGSIPRCFNPLSTCLLAVAGSNDV